MPGEPLDNPDKTRDQETAEEKQTCMSAYATAGVKKAAAAAVGREFKTINEWEAADEEFRLAMLGAEYRFLDKNRNKVKLDNVFANLFDEYKPPKQELDVNLPTTITINHVHPPNHDQPDAKTG